MRRIRFILNATSSYPNMEKHKQEMDEDGNYYSTCITPVEWVGFTLEDINWLRFGRDTSKYEVV